MSNDVKNLENKEGDEESHNLTPETTDELSDQELDKASGGVSLKYQKIEWKYTSQKSDG